MIKVAGLCLLSFALVTQLVAHEVEEGSFERTLRVSGPVELDLKTASGGITVTKGTAGSVRVHAFLKAEHGWFSSDDVSGRLRELERNPPVEQTGNRIRVGYVTGRDLLQGISMRLEIETPVDTRVGARAASGGIRVDGVHGPVECRTASGGIEIHDVAADVRASAASGGVHIERVKGAVLAHASSGGIEAVDVAGEIEAETQSGSMRLEQTVAAPIHARAASGGVEIRLARGSGYDVSASTGSGRITTPAMTVQGSYSRHHVEGKIGGGGPVVSVRAASGSVRIE